MASYKRYKVGQRFRGIPVRTLNALAADIERLQQQTGQPVGAALESRGDAPAWLLVPVRNMTGLDLVEYAIAGVDGSAYTLPTIVAGSPDQNTADAAVLQSPALEIVSPSATTHAHKWVVVLGPLANGASGWAVAAGLVPVRINQLHADHAFARPATGDAVYLQSAGYGAPVWFRRLAGTGKQWGLVQLGAVTSTLPLQLAVCTSATTAAPAYSGVPSDFSFKIQGVGDFVGEAVLLNASQELAWGASGLEVKIHRPTGTETIEQLKFGFLNLHKDRVINVGDVIRVWTNDGTAVVPGMSLSHSSGPDVYAELWDGTGGTGGDRLVAADDSDTAPGELIEKLFATGPLTVNDNLVYAVVDAGPPRKVVLHTRRYTGAIGVVVGGQLIALDSDNLDTGAAKQVFGHAAGDYGWFDDEGGGVTYTAGCGISLAGDAIAVVGSVLAGAGLVASGCVLAVGAGCGITVAADAISIDRAALIGVQATLMNGAGTCDLEVRDAWKVKSTANDSTPNYLHDAINDNGTYVSGQDPLVKNDTVGAGGTDQKERLFFDSSAVADWTSATPQVFGHESDGTVHWWAVGCGLQVTADHSLKVDPAALAGCGLEVASDNQGDIDGPCKLKVKPSDLAGKGLQAAASGNEGDGNGPCKMELKLGCGLQFTSGDCVAVKPLDLAGDGLAVDSGNQSDCDGPCKLKVATNVTIKVPTSIELNLVGSTLEVKLNYTNYDVYGVVGSTGNLSDTVATTAC